MIENGLNSQLINRDGQLLPPEYYSYETYPINLKAGVTKRLNVTALSISFIDIVSELFIAVGESREVKVTKGMTIQATIHSPFQKLSLRSDTDQDITLIVNAGNFQTEATLSGLVEGARINLTDAERDNLTAIWETVALNEVSDGTIAALLDPAVIAAFQTLHEAALKNDRPDTIVTGAVKNITDIVSVAIAARGDRHAVEVFNDAPAGGAKVYVGSGTVTAATGIPIEPQGSKVLSGTFEVSAICEAGKSANIRLLEVRE